MGDFLNDLKAARYAPVAIRQRFRIEYDETGDDVYAFFESTDDGTFYRKQILNYVRSGGRLQVYYCGNKHSVWYHYELSEQEGRLRNTLFFVDKDLDDLTGKALPTRQRIFVTDFYAIENYVCTEAAVISALEEVIFLPYEQESYSRVINEFRKGFEELAAQLRPLFAEIIVMRQQSVDVSFNDLGEGLSACFEMTGLKPEPRPDWDSIFRKTCKYDISNVPPTDLKAMLALLAAKPHHEWMRGKFALWFFLKFVGGLWTHLIGSLINDRKKIKKTVELKPDNVFLIMQGKHPLPNGLSPFLITNIA